MSENDDEILRRFGITEEISRKMYHEDPTYRSVVDSLAHGADPYKLLITLINSLRSTRAELEKLALNGPAPVYFGPIVYPEKDVKLFNQLKEIGEANPLPVKLSDFDTNTFEHTFKQLSLGEFKWDIKSERRPIPPKERLICKLPMQRICLAEDGGIWYYCFIDNKIQWRLRGYGFFEKHPTKVQDTDTD